MDRGKEGEREGEMDGRKEGRMDRRMEGGRRGGWRDGFEWVLLSYTRSSNTRKSATFFFSVNDKI